MLQVVDGEDATDLNSCVSKMLDYFYSADYSDGAGAASTVFVHARMYAIADRYAVPALKSLATSKFKQARALRDIVVSGASA
ncbi:hypothetical protein LTS18_014052, partial [Coniosporium uncinatum]